VRIEALGYREGGANDSEPHYRQPVSYDVGTFMVQVGAFTVRENAYRLAEKLRGQYGQTAVAEGWVNGQKFYRVRVGLYASLVLAGDALQEIERSGYANSFIVAQ
jgi:rare lipoprotein A